MKDCLLPNSASWCLKFALSCNAMKLSRYIMWFFLEFERFLCTIVTYIDQNYVDTYDNGYPQQQLLLQQQEKESQEEGSVQIKQCENCGDKCDLTSGDIEIITSCLNIEGSRNEELTRDHEVIMEGAYELLDEKNASLEELRRAFHVFDRDEDGFISALELWSVLRKLGFKEGMKFEDCETMICAFDLDGDGMISFHEFKHMMENAS
ncbi:hypothetical protein LUZ60_011319 [Juncus effusus]|nr:hypothetical protein LUZ60_011319 [Juncus effusus]